ncbi:MAG: hypothetical protein HZB26_14995 [Candidatus Hydrogenedentes bacterium]|nr:hypothetical protein [Candidatus Hydrogenedentota bacterium]
MNTRKHIRNVLLVLAIGSLLYVAVKEAVERRNAAANAAAPESLTPVGGRSPKLIVYYFSEGKLCTTCENIEAYTREALETHFAAELATGDLSWRPIDVDDPRNEHYISEYNIYTKSVVLVRIENGNQVSWKNLESIWDFVNNKTAFVDYVRAETREYLDAPP